ncbi:MAG: Tad domain-containing protein [Chloroflexota bacterium]
MKNKKHRSEKGQAMYLMVIGIVVLVGFTGLSIDGGRLYSDRRQAQSVADNAAFAAASVVARNKLNGNDGPTGGWNGSSLFNRAKRAANEILTDNGYGNSDSNVTNLSVTLTKQTDQGTYFEIIVEFDSTIPPTLIQVVYGGELISHSFAKVHIRPKVNLSFGYGMYALNDHECDALSIGGNITVDVDNTGIFSNSDGQNGTCSSADYGGSSQIDIEEDFTAAGTIDINGSGTGGSFSTGSTVENAPQQTIPYIPTPDCSGLPAVTQTNSGGTWNYTPGVYSGNLGIHNQIHIFAPGMYCITGDFTVTGGDVIGTDLFFYLSTGKLSINGGPVDVAAAPKGVSTTIDASGNDWGGMLFYLDKNNSSAVNLNGNAGSVFRGTLFAPASECTINGGNTTDGFQTQVVCNTIKLSGTADIWINMDAATYYEPPATLDLIQ